MASIVKKALAELGFTVLAESSRDTKILCLQRFVRFLAYGGSTLVLTLYLVALGNSAARTGLFMTLTLLGDVVISLVLTLVADAIGRRRMLAVGSLLMTASGIIFAIFNNYWILVFASIFGVISPSGNEIGPFKAIEESTISQLVSSADRSTILAWYMLSGTAGAAIGTVSCGWVVQQLQNRYGWSDVSSYKIVFWVYSLLGIVKFSLSIILSADCEVPPPEDVSTEEDIGLLEVEGHEAEESTSPDRTQASIKAKPKSRSNSKSYLPSLSRDTQLLILRLGLLFAMDSFGSGLSPATWMIYFFHNKFGLSEAKLGNLFFFTNIISSASTLVASSLARRIGLVKTMVFTHVPASIALTFIPIPSNLIIAMTLLIFRSSTSSMDQAPRQAFLAAAVRPEERTSVMGIINVVKTLSQSAGPLVTGSLAGSGIFWMAFVLAGSLKLTYDVAFLWMFLGYQTIEDKAQNRSDVQPTQSRGENEIRN